MRTESIMRLRRLDQSSGCAGTLLAHAESMELRIPSLSKPKLRLRLLLPVLSALLRRPARGLLWLEADRRRSRLDRICIMATGIGRWNFEHNMGALSIPE